MTNEYHLPGIRVAERRIAVPLDWSAGTLRVSAPYRVTPVRMVLA